MKIKTYVSLVIAVSGLVVSGCVTTHATKGFQTNPSFKTSKGFPHSFAKEKESNGVQKFFSSLVGKKSSSLPTNQDGVPLDADATSLHSKGTLSPELLISLGKMGIAKGRYDSAASYFERALQMDPKNAEAKSGLAEAKAKVGNIQNSQQNYNTNQPNGTNLINPLGSTKEIARTRTGIQLVAFEEVDDENSASNSGPDSISMESVDIPKPPEMIMQPEIQFGGSPNRQRVANPFFGTTKSADLKSMAGEQVVEKTTPEKLSIVQPASQKTKLRLSDE